MSTHDLVQLRERARRLRSAAIVRRGGKVFVIYTKEADSE